MRRALSPRPPRSCANDRESLNDLAAVRIVDSLFQDRRRLEHHYAPRRYRHFLAGLGVTPYALALLAHHEGTERREFHRFAPLKQFGVFFNTLFESVG